MMLLKYLKYRFVKARLAAYLDGELAPNTRRFIAREIDENPRAYREYLAARQTKQELERHLPSFGKPEAGQLDAIWANIQGELQKEARPRRPLRPQFSFAYGFAVIVIAMLLLAPLAFDTHRASASALPSLPAPEIQTTSPAITEAQVTTVALGATDDLAKHLQNTPEAPTGTNP